MIQIIHNKLWDVIVTTVNNSLLNRVYNTFNNRVMKRGNVFRYDVYDAVHDNTENIRERIGESKHDNH
jgi:hypothetical protein